MKKLAGLRRPSHTTVVAYLSLFLVVSGGAAYAAAKIGSKQLRANAVTASKIKRGAVISAKIRNRAVTAAKLGNGAVTAAKLGRGGQLAKLGDGAVGSAKIAANAVGGAQADEASFQGLIKGNGSIQSHAASVPAANLLSAPAVVATIPGFGDVRLTFCGDFPEKDRMGVQLLSSNGSQPFTFVGTVIGANNPAGTGKPQFNDTSGGTIGDGTGSLLFGQLPGVETPGPTGIDGKWEFQLSRGEDPNATTAHVSVAAVNDSTNTRPSGDCHISAVTTIVP